MAIINVTPFVFSVDDISTNPAPVSNFYGIENCIDEDTNSSCILNTTPGQRGYFVFNLGSPQIIYRVRFKVGYNSPWKIELSNDNINYIFNQEIESPNTFGFIDTIVTTVMPARYIRISAVDESEIISSTYKVRLFDFNLWTANVLKTFEFNDSVLTTKAWNSSRYNGKQLQSNNINTFNENDISYGKTSVVSNYSRIFYIANEIISLSGSGQTPWSDEDDTLHKIPGFSYISIDQSVLVNYDNTVETTDINIFSENTLDRNSNLFYSPRLRGFQREFETNIPIGSKVNIKLIDDSAKKRPLKNYPVFFNQGKFRQVFIYANINDNAVGSFIGTATSTDNGYQLYRAASTDPNEYISGSLLIKPNMRRLIQDFYTGSIVNGLNTRQEYSEFIEGLNNYKTSNPLDQSKRIFLTSLKGTYSGSDADGLGSNYTAGVEDDLPFSPNKRVKFTGEVINTNNSESIYNITNDIYQLSTYEVSNFGATSQGGVANLINPYRSILSPMYREKSPQITTFSANRKYTYSVGTMEGVVEGTAILPENEYGGSYSVSLLDDSIPSLLVPLTKEIEYPEGIGNKIMIVLPENLHPFIKDNLIHFLAKAGFDIGDRKVVPALDNTNINLL